MTSAAHLIAYMRESNKRRETVWVCARDMSIIYASTTYSRDQVQIHGVTLGLLRELEAEGWLHLRRDSAEDELGVWSIWPAAGRAREAYTEGERR